MVKAENRFLDSVSVFGMNLSGRMNKNGMKNFMCGVTNTQYTSSSATSMQKVKKESLFQIVSLGHDLHLIFHDNVIELIDSELNSLGLIESSIMYNTLDSDHVFCHSPKNYNSVFHNGRHYIAIGPKVFYLGYSGLCFL